MHLIYIPQIRFSLHSVMFKERDLLAIQSILICESESIHPFVHPSVLFPSSLSSGLLVLTNTGLINRLVFSFTLTKTYMGAVRIHGKRKDENGHTDRKGVLGGKDGEGHCRYIKQTFASLPITNQGQA